MSVYDGVSPPEFDAAVRSLQTQTLSNFELLIMQDDVRRPELKERLERYAVEDRRVKLFATDVRGGLAAAMNRLIPHAVAPYVARMDADDVSYPNRLQRQVDYLDAHLDVMILGTMTHELDAQGRVVFEKRLPTGDAEIRALHCYRDPFVHPSVMFRRSVFDIVGLYSERPETHYLEDTDLWSRALLAGLKTANLPEFLFGFRVNSGLYQRRGGAALAWRELRMRWTYARQAGFGRHRSLPAIGVALMRIGPAGLRRRLYQNCRNGLNFGKGRSAALTDTARRED